MKIKRYCELCGADYWTGNGKAKYCSEACKKEASRRRQAKWRAENPDYFKKYIGEHPEALARFKERHPNYERDRWRKIRGTKTCTGTCVVCGASFTTLNPVQKTCSTKCGIKFKNSRKERRIPKNQIVDKDITLEALYRRDSGVCYLCGAPCDWNDKNGTIVGDNYPSMDHVVPVSKGGLHSWGNIRLAHFGCNRKKADALPPEAM